MHTLRTLTLALALTGLLSTPLMAADPAAQPVRILASLPITYGLGQLLLALQHGFAAQRLVSRFFG